MLNELLGALIRSLLHLYYLLEKGHFLLLVVQVWLLLGQGKMYLRRQWMLGEKPLEQIHWLQLAAMEEEADMTCLE